VDQVDLAKAIFTMMNEMKEIDLKPKAMFLPLTYIWFILFILVKLPFRSVVHNQKLLFTMMNEMN
jgi:hypothetical protein